MIFWIHHVSFQSWVPKFYLEGKTRFYKNILYKNNFKYTFVKKKNKIYLNVKKGTKI